MTYVDPQTVHNPATGLVAPAAWGDVIRDNLEFLIDPPACSIFASAAQLIPTGVSTALTANGENYDNDSMHSTVTNPERITVQTPGRYLLIATLSFAPNATGMRNVLFRVNGTTSYGSSLVNAVTTGNSTGVTGVRSLVLAAGDYVDCLAQQTSGGNLNVTLEEFVATFFTR